MKKHWKLLTILSLGLLAIGVDKWADAQRTYALGITGPVTGVIRIRKPSYPADGSLCFLRVDDGGAQCVKVPVYLLREQASH